MTFQHHRRHRANSAVWACCRCRCLAKVDAVSAERRNASTRTLSRQRARIRREAASIVWRITRIEKGSAFTWVTRSPGLSVTAHHLVEATRDGSRATLSIRFEGLLAPLVASLTHRLNNRYLRLEGAGLKRRSEERS